MKLRKKVFKSRRKVFKICERQWTITGIPLIFTTSLAAKRHLKNNVLF